MSVGHRSYATLVEWGSAAKDVYIGVRVSILADLPDKIDRAVLDAQE
jgi:hypothetical protein